MVDAVEDVEIIAVEVEDAVVGAGVELLEVVGVVEAVDKVVAVEGVDDAVVGEEELVKGGVDKTLIVLVEVLEVLVATIVVATLVVAFEVSGVVEAVVEDTEFDVSLVVLEVFRIVAFKPLWLRSVPSWFPVMQTFEPSDFLTHRLFVFIFLKFPVVAFNTVVVIDCASPLTSVASSLMLATIGAMRPM